MKPETQSFYVAAVTRAARRVIDALDEALELEALAREAALSPFHFHRVFRGLLGETPLELHRRLRLERAAHRLATTEQPVTQIAFEAGYHTHEAFTRAFRAAYARSPSELRAAARQPALRPPLLDLAARSGVHFGRAHLPPIQPGVPMSVTIVDRPALRVATVRHIGPYAQIASAFQRLHALVAPAGLLRPGAEMLAIYHDDPEVTPAEALRADAALTVPADAALPAGVGEDALPAGRYALAVHTGPYEGLGDAWARLMGGWLPRSGERVGAGACYERYRNTPMDAPPEALTTELYLPLAP